MLSIEGTISCPLKLIKSSDFIVDFNMYNCKIDTHSKLFKQTVKDLVAKRGKELGLLKGSTEWSQMVTQIRRDLQKQIANIESQYNFIAPGLQLLNCKKLSNTNGLYSLKYAYETESNRRNFSIVSDSKNLPPDTLLWCINNRHKLIENATDAEQKAWDKLVSLSKIRIIKQKPFFICDKVYFADLYLEQYNTIIEIDGGYHRTQCQKRKDEERTIYLNSAGIKVIRLSNEDIMTMRLYDEILNIVKAGNSFRQN